ncbi:DUF6415 family natural product biosynthesis protein [Streptomyces gamaensis]|uniref:DUF6415 family natural product biosynthesis protein n=1 Tax=Streptomyces gamaensis TaxID=1763542 RepID=A0ABW0Z546_9ACTN
MPHFPGTAMPPFPLGEERKTLQQKLKEKHPLVTPENSARNVSGLERDVINTTVRWALDQLPLAGVVDGLIAELRRHIASLVPVVEAKDWERHGRGQLVGLILREVRAKLDAVPPADAQAAGKAVYAQELARTCRALLSLALADPGDEQQHTAVAP